MTVIEMPFPDLPDDTDFPDTAIEPAQQRAAQSADGALEHAHMLELALDNMTHGLCVYDAQGRLQMFNARYLELHGFTRDEIKIGWTFLDLVRHLARSGHFSGDPDQYAVDIAAGLAKDGVVERQPTLTNGRTLLCTHTLTASGERVTTHRDITDQVRAEAERDRTQNFLDTVITNVPAIIMVKDAVTMQYVLINKRAEEYFGMSAAEVIGKTPYELFEKELADRITARDRKALAGDRIALVTTPLHDTAIPGQIVRVKKEVVHDADGTPKYLINIVEDITERAQAAERVAYMSRYDALTGLANRTRLLEIMSGLLAQAPEAAGGPKPFNLLLLDIDRFKDINDTLGHPVGDALLMAIAARLKDLAGKDDVVARISGDEFAILQMAGDEARDSAVAHAARVIGAMLEPFHVEGHHIETSASIGIAIAPEHGLDADGLIKCADLALYRAKSSGRNQYSIFESTMEAEVNIRRTLETELRKALAAQEFELRYQPIVNAINKDIAAVEALVRWNSPLKGLVSPEHFIPLAEETGLIVPLGDWVMRRACTDAAGWPDSVKVSVNLSAIQFSKGDIVGLVSSALDESGLAPERLELEITETVLLHKNEDNISLLHALKNLGVAIVLDDFGTGYSSLSYLKMFPFDKIKIDRSFINEMSTRTDCAAIVCAVTGLGRSLNITTTAEGVETQEQFTLLRAVGCTQIQGYLFGRPVPAAELPFDGAQTRPQHRAVAEIEAPRTAPQYPVLASDLPRQIA
ncbi:MAG: putative bifunctional diguanylate cyclase/phosphodiesterase [Xanthobacteraceae bacterium]|uniref:putative bifunctional diguanylate cyclase/phosphodiesterase n=1 Tax=Pseudolabrys sp. TaxID=1960880 RepID=UPI003D0D6529